MERLKVLLVIALIYFGGHVFYGYLDCASNFCPGDSEREYIYEYTDNNGKTFIVENGVTIPKEQYNGK